MDKTNNTANEKKQTMLAFLSLLLSAAGVVLGYLIRSSGDSFGIGTIAAFGAVLVSLMAVKNRGHNILAKIVFFVSVAALFAAVGMNAVR